MNPDAFKSLSPAEAAALTQSLPSMSVEEKIALFDMLEEREKRDKLHTARASTLGLAHHVYPGFKEGAHHRVLSKVFEDVMSGRKKRVIINIAPRMGKSEFGSYLFPAHFIGTYPEKKIIMGTHTSGLSEDFGRRVKNLVDSEEMQELYPGTTIASDQKAAGKWSTSQGGQYYAVGVGGSIAGRGADLFVIDDPHALLVSTLVPTPKGFRTIEALEVGDEVYGPDGLPARITHKSEVRHNRPLFDARTDDGESILCDGGHLWSYNPDTNLSKSHIVKTATARELALWDKPNKPYLPRHAAVQYPHRELLIDPYVLGAWLGDGTSTLGRMTAHPDDAPAMREEFEAAGYPTNTLADPYSFGIRGLRVQLRELGVLGNKHIPEAYLTASEEQRFALLQGLMDTDGTVTTAGQCSFQNTNKLLVEGARELLQSLGFKPQMCQYTDTRDRHTTRKQDYRINFKMAECFRMTRKSERTYTSQDKRRRSLTIVPTEQRGSVQCITIDRADGQFLVGRGYVVTHNSEQSVKANSTLAFDSAWSWYQQGPLQRLMPGGAILIIMTRWSTKDLTGRLLAHQAKNPGSDEWEVIELPAILHEGTDREKSLWPEQWPLEELKGKKAGMDPRYWNAQYMQQPTSDNSAIIARTAWQVWPHEEPPKVEYVIQSWDTAFEAKESADYSACTTWGVWYDEERNSRPSLILLDAFKDRMEFPELKATALKHYKEWKPDAFIVEKKAAGAPLIQELRRAGIPVQEFSPSRGNDKIVRLNAVSDLFSQGAVWAPDTRWAKEVIEEVASFPNGDNDDYCFVAGTQIRMADGAQRPIEQLCVGEYVQTPEGPRRITAAGQTGVSEVWELCVGQRVLHGTAAHPVYSQGVWKRLDSLCPLEDTAGTYKRDLKWLPNKLQTMLRQWFLTDDGIAGTPKAQTPHTGDISGVPGTDCIEMCGSTTTAQSQPGTISTTKTGTLGTTASKTWSASPQKSITQSTAKNVCREENPQNSSHTLLKSAALLLRGTGLKQAVRGMWKMLKRLSPLHVRLQNYGSSRFYRCSVCGAVRVLLQKMCGQGSAPQNASLRNQNSRQVKAVRNTHTTQPVFNLTVEGAHCYYAEDILVHNCDTVSQALLRYRQGGFIPLDSDEQDESEALHRHRQKAYY